jgi:Flp pilus assembly protein TadG
MSEQPMHTRTINRFREALGRAGAPLQRLLGNRQGVVGVALALLFVPVVMVVGAAVDYARLEQFKTQLQSTVDSAALSGAAVYIDASSNANAISVAGNYITANVSLLPSHIGAVTPSVSAAQITAGSNQGNTVTVTATASIGTTFMRIITSTMNVSASATAVNPLVNITISASHFSANAGDGNTLYYYKISASNPGAIPAVSSITSSQKLASNTTTNNPSVTIPNVSATQKIGMALKNVTGQNTDYGCTQFQTAPTTQQWVSTGYNSRTRQETGYYQTITQSCQGTTQWFFSSIMPPNNNSNNSSSIDTGYLSETQNCSLQVTVTSALPGNTVAPVSGVCFNSIPTYAAPSCAQLNGQYANFWWNDMGGNSDDKDYNDAEISISCSGVNNNATGVYLSS